MFTFDLKKLQLAFSSVHMAVPVTGISQVQEALIRRDVKHTATRYKYLLSLQQ